MKHDLFPPKLKLTAVLSGLAICLCGCSSSYTVSSTGKPNSEYGYQEMNKELVGRDVHIELKGGNGISAKEVNVSDDSVSWVDQRTDEKSKVGIGEINKFVIKNHFLGGLEGFGFGAIGSGVGMTVAFPVGPNTAGIPSYAPAVVGGLLGGGIGLMTGLIIGHSYNYELLMTEQSDSLQNAK